MRICRVVSRGRCASLAAPTRHRRCLLGATKPCELGTQPLARTSRLKGVCGLFAVLALVSAVPVRGLDNWTIHITVDNQYAIYFGTAATTTGAVVGTDLNWPDTETWNAVGKLSTDYTYVATASDYRTAQGFLAEFVNTTQNYTFLTGDPEWTVCPAGLYAATNPFFPNPWPASTMPTQAQVDTAIAYCTVNNLWVAPTTAAGYTNSASTQPWGLRPNIPGNAQWIWYESGNVPSGSYPTPFQGGNHQEFLVFRVQPVPVTPQPPVPAVSGWGIMVLVLSVLTGIAIKFGRRQAAGRVATNV